MRRLTILLCGLGLLGLTVPAHAQTLTWTYPSGTAATGFNVYRGSGTPCVATVKINTVAIPITTLSYTDGTAPAGAAYCYAVTALNVSMESAPSNTVAYTIPLPPPTLVTVTASLMLGGAGAGGNLVSSPAGFDMDRPGMVQATFAPGMPVRLTATPKPNGSQFLGWGGACAAAGTDPVCQLTLAMDTMVSAKFTR